MTPHGRRNAAYLVAIVMVVALCIVFPRVLAFAELAAREIRYLWWLILIAVVGVYFAFFAGRKRD